MPQTEFAERLGVDRKSVAGWEADKRLPDGSSLLKLVTEFGADVNYLLTGSRDPAGAKLDAAEQVLLDSYRRCNAQARQNLIQTAALFAAGLGAGSPAGAGGMSNSGAHTVQVGGGANVNVNAPVYGGVAGRNINNRGETPGGRKK